MAAVRGLLKVRAPALENDDVAVAPKYDGPYEEKRELEALLNCCRAVQVFACPRFRVAVSVPEVVIGVPPIVKVELASDRATDVTLPEF